LNTDGGEEEDRTPDLRIANTNKSRFLWIDRHTSTQTSHCILTNILKPTADPH
jgi:hypothetical protein